MSTMITKESGATGSPPADDGAQASPLRRYCFEAERLVESTQRAEISVIARSEEEGRDKAQAEVDENEVEWDEDDFDEGEAQLSLGSTEELSDEEIEDYLEEQREEAEAVKAAEQRATRRRGLNSILASLRTTTSEEERAGLIDELEQLID